MVTITQNATCRDIQYRCFPCISSSPMTNLNASDWSLHSYAQQKCVIGCKTKKQMLIQVDSAHQLTDSASSTEVSLSSSVQLKISSHPIMSVQSN